MNAKIWLANFHHDKTEKMFRDSVLKHNIESMNTHGKATLSCAVLNEESRTVDLFLISDSDPSIEDVIQFRNAGIYARDLGYIMSSQTIVANRLLAPSVSKTAKACGIDFCYQPTSVQMKTIRARRKRGTYVRR
ncbi:hypothetical protein [Bdellovibrio sp. HCB209]|uniref:hypothetical protein n=1 Tax=Bdellovibrio sp. HCB209 TaxID=3394354 RepID=UPI0039B386E0